MNGVVKVPLRFGKIQTKLSNRSDISGSVLRICRVCQESNAVYTCPRCRVPYCTLNCYKKHGENCTEAFYKENVLKTIALNEKSYSQTEAKQELNELFLRVKQFQDKASEFNDGNGKMDEQELSDERLEELAEHVNQLKLTDLTVEEQQLFLREVANGHVGKQIAQWKPWWLQQNDLSIATENEGVYLKKTHHIRVMRSGKLIEDLSPDDGEENIGLQDEVMNYRSYPSSICTDVIRKDIPKLEDLMRGKATSDSLQYNLLDLLYSYSRVMRLYNGDWENDSTDALAYFLSLCTVLSEDQKFFSAVDLFNYHLLQYHQSSNTACSNEKESTHTGDRKSSEKSNVSLSLMDLYHILSADIFMLDILVDIRSLVNTGTKTLQKQSKKKSKALKEDLKMLKGVERKVHFYIVWVNEICSTQPNSNLFRALQKSYKVELEHFLE